jgi:hypothetical protein
MPAGLEFAILQKYHLPRLTVIKKKNAIEARKLTPAVVRRPMMLNLLVCASTACLN